MGTYNCIGHIKKSKELPSRGLKNLLTVRTLWAFLPVVWEDHFYSEAFIGFILIDHDLDMKCVGIM